MNTDKISLEQLDYAKGTLSGLLNFSIRSGLVVGDRCEACANSIADEDRSPEHRCRCGYESALETAIRCIDLELCRRGQESVRTALEGAARREGKTLAEYVEQYQDIDSAYVADLKKVAGLPNSILSPNDWANTTIRRPRRMAAGSAEPPDHHIFYT